MITWEIITDAIPTDSGLTQADVDLAKQLTQKAAENWGQYIDSDVTLTIQLRLGTTEPVFGNPVEGLAFSTSLDHVFLRVENGQEIVEPGALFEMRTGTDPNGAKADIVITLNPNKLATLSLDPTPDTSGDVGMLGNAGQVDFMALIMHELGHSLGMTAFVLGPDLGAASRITTFDLLSEDQQGGRFFVGENAVGTLGVPVPVTNNGHIGLPIGAVTDPFSVPDTDASKTFRFDVFRDTVYTQFRPFVSSLDIAIMQDLGVPLLAASDSDDLLFGYQRENDTLRGLAGNDTLIGLSGADALWGSDGDDRLFGGNGRDTIGGGDGNDFLVGDDEDIVAPITVTGFPADINIDSDIMFGGAGDDVIITGAFKDLNDNGLYDSGEALTDAAVENTVWAGAGDDTIVGTDGDEILGGSSGNDDIQALGGDDIIYGGRETVPSATVLNDNIDAGEGDDTVYGAKGNDSINGGAGDDFLFNGAGNDTVSGGDGADELWAGLGDDLLSGGAGADTFAFNAAGGHDTITDYAVDEDTLNLRAFGLQSLSDLQAVASDTSVDGQAGLLLDLSSEVSVFLIGLGVSDLTSADILL